MTKLNQVIAIEKGVKSRVYGEITEFNKLVQKKELFEGFTKTYRPSNEAGETLPQERKRVQYTVEDLLRRSASLLTELMDVSAKRDWANTRATASVVVDDVLLVHNVPVTYILFLEKQFTDFRKFIDNLPVLDEAEDWKKDALVGLYKTEAITTHRTKKVQKPIVLYKHTAEHPAQTQLITEDELVGYWDQIKMSGAIPKPLKQQLMDRINKLLKAFEEAREDANSVGAEDNIGAGDALMNYLLQPLD